MLFSLGLHIALKYHLKNLQFLTHDMLCPISNYLSLTWIINFTGFPSLKYICLSLGYVNMQRSAPKPLKQQIRTVLPSTLFFRWRLLSYHELGRLEGWVVWIFLVHHLSYQLSYTTRKAQFSPSLKILSPPVSALDWFLHQGLQFQCNRSHLGHSNITAPCQQEWFHYVKDGQNPQRWHFSSTHLCISSLSWNT